MAQYPAEKHMGMDGVRDGDTRLSLCFVFSEVRPLKSVH